MEIPASEVAQIEAERARILFRNAPIGVIASCMMGCGAAAFMAIDDSAVLARALGWSVALVLCTAYHLAICFIFLRSQAPMPRFAVCLFVLAALLEGLCWGAGVFLFADPERYYRQLVMLSLSSGLVASTAFVLSTHLAPFRAFFYPAILPNLIVQPLYPYPLHWLTTTMVVAFLIAVTIATERSNEQIVEVLRLRFRNETLAKELGRARDVAEEANLAKSRFLAAASHDLRQPVHALGLFTGAMRARKMDAKARELLDRVDGSITSLDGLFTSLLDISKLDAGAVEPEIRCFAVDPILVRICEELREQALATAVDLRLARSAALILSDPALLETVIRNLVANAVKYTPGGKVLVGCRVVGKRISIEVLDNGPGIAPELQGRIFDEFVQIANPERDRSKGLGLGLSIVKRMVPLIGGELVFRSEPRKGTMFRVIVPKAYPTDVSAHAADAAEGPMLLAGKSVLVIDDELDVRLAMNALLASWGYRVVLAGSGTEALEHIASGYVNLDLLLCDFRLRDGENGIETIATIRRALASEVPAILITGDTAPERIAEAQGSDLMLLHKPVPNARLRTAVGNVIRAGKQS